jgi:hypothetical protein
MYQIILNRHGKALRNSLMENQDTKCGVEDPIWSISGGGHIIRRLSDLLWRSESRVCILAGLPPQGGEFLRAL